MTTANLLCRSLSRPTNKAPPLKAGWLVMVGCFHVLRDSNGFLETNANLNRIEQHRIPKNK